MPANIVVRGPRGPQGIPGVGGVVAPASIDASDADENDVITCVGGTAVWSPGGAGGSPGGSTTQVQYNKAGAFGGDAAFTFDDTGKVLTVANLVAKAGYIAGTSVDAADDVPPDGVIRLGYNAPTTTDPLPVIRIREHDSGSDFTLVNVSIGSSSVEFGSFAWNTFIYGSAFQIQAGRPSVVDTISGVSTDLTEVSLVLASNFTDTSGTVANTTLSFTMNDPNEIWEIECYGNTKAVTSGGCKFRLTLPLNALYEGSVEGVAATLTARNATVLSGTATAAVSATSGAFTSGNNIPGYVRIFLRVKGDGVNGGAITLQFAAVTAGQTATLFAGFYMRARRVTEV